MSDGIIIGAQAVGRIGGAVPRRRGGGAGGEGKNHFDAGDGIVAAGPPAGILFHGVRTAQTFTSWNCMSSIACLLGVTTVRSWERTGTCIIT